jgi:hypothetical protein
VPATIFSSTLLAECTYSERALFVRLSNEIPQSGQGARDAVVPGAGTDGQFLMTANHAAGRFAARGMTSQEVSIGSVPTQVRRWKPRQRHLCRDEVLRAYPDEFSDGDVGVRCASCSLARDHFT